MCKSAAHIVILALARLYELLELGNDTVKASLALVVDSEAVVYLFSAVETENYVGTFTVCKVDNVVVNEHTVGGKRKAEVFVMLLLYASGISNKLFYDIKVQKGLTAKEIDLKVSSCT